MRNKLGGLLAVALLTFFWIPGAFAADPGSAPSAKSQAAPATLSKNESDESVLNTLNDALEENRKIRQNMKEMQIALQQKTIESEDLKSELRKLEGLALERNHELGQKVADLDKQIKVQKDAAAAVEADKQAFEAEKIRIESETKHVTTENKKLRKMLSNSILAEEKDEIVDIARKNEEVAANTETTLTQLSSENQSARNEMSGVYYEMGNLYFKVKQYQDAANAYKKVIEHDPSNAWAYHNLAVIEDYYLADTKSAYVHYQQYLNYKPIEEEAQEVRRRVLDLNLLQKVSPETPLSREFEKFHDDTHNAKL